MKTAVFAPLLALAVAAPLAHGAPLVRIFDERRFASPKDATAETNERLERLILPAGWTPRLCGKGRRWFTVLDVAAGAFTRKGSAQKAVLYEACEMTRHSREQGIAVLEDGRVVAHLSYEGGDIALGALPDIDGNGLSELLVYDFANGQGSAYGGVRLLELGTEGVRKLGRFVVHEDDCGAHEHGGREIATVLHASSGAAPTFFKQTFTRRCESKGPWCPRGAQAPAAPEIDDNDTYLRLR